MKKQNRIVLFISKNAIPLLILIIAIFSLIFAIIPQINKPSMKIYTSLPDNIYNVSELSKIPNFTHPFSVNVYNKRNTPCLNPVIITEGIIQRGTIYYPKEENVGMFSSSEQISKFVLRETINSGEALAISLTPNLKNMKEILSPGGKIFEKRHSMIKIHCLNGGDKEIYVDFIR